MGQNFIQMALKWQNFRKITKIPQIPVYNTLELPQFAEATAR